VLINQKTFLDSTKREIAVTIVHNIVGGMVGGAEQVEIDSYATAVTWQIRKSAKLKQMCPETFAHN